MRGRVVSLIRHGFWPIRARAGSFLYYNTNYKPWTWKKHYIQDINGMIVSKRVWIVPEESDTPLEVFRELFFVIGSITHFMNCAFLHLWIRLQIENKYRLLFHVKSKLQVMLKWNQKLHFGKLFSKLLSLEDMKIQDDVVEKSFEVLACM